MAALERRRAEQEADRSAAGEFWEEWGLVFTTRAGTPFSPRNDYRDFIARLGEAELRRTRLHDVRHTAAPLMLARGVPARVIMHTLRHSQISIALNTYSHVSPELSRDAADRMESLIDGDRTHHGSAGDWALWRGYEWRRDGHKWRWPGVMSGAALGI